MSNKKAQSLSLAEKGTKTLDDIINQALANSDDVITGEITHQRAVDSATNLRAAVNAIEVHHALGGDTSRFVVKPKV